MDKKKPLSIVATMLILLSVVALTPLVGQFSISSDEKEFLDFTSFKADKLELTRTEIKIHTEFVTSRTLDILYREAGGTAENVLAFSRVISEGECLIFSVTPEDWDDHRSLAMLGHEVLHCLGGQHS